MKTLIAIFGKSASGKDTLCRQLCEKLPNAHKIKLDTTRPRRKNESDDDYNFISIEDMLKHLQDFPFGYYTVGYRHWYYGVNIIKEISENDLCIGVFSPKMIDKIYDMEHLHNLIGNQFRIIPIYIDQDWQERLHRSIEREGHLKPEMLRRLVADAFDFRKIERRLVKNFGSLIYTQDSSLEDIVYPLT